MHVLAIRTADPPDSSLDWWLCTTVF